MGWHANPMGWHANQMGWHGNPNYQAYPEVGPATYGVARAATLGFSKGGRAATPGPSEPPPPAAPIFLCFFLSWGHLGHF
jgi:hypothetical protein